MSKRYEAIEVEGRWYVIDHKRPDAGAVECDTEAQAKMNERLWNAISAPTRLS